MGESYTPIVGECVRPEALRLPRAIGFVRAVAKAAQDSVVECRRFSSDNGYVESVVVDICVECPQQVVHDVRPIERIAACFDEKDTRAPEVLALRESFPLVPHLNLVFAGQAKSLCLYADVWESQRLRWNGKTFLERIREWLRLTSRGELHQEDQPLEPLLFDSGFRVILPHQWLESEKSDPLRLVLTLHSSHPYERVLMATSQDGDDVQEPEKQFLLLRVVTPPMTHGVIHRIPRHFGELASFTDRDGFSLLAEVRKQLGSIPQADRHRKFVLLVDFPKRRGDGQMTESTEHKAFLTLDPVVRVGESLGLWKSHGGAEGLLLGDTSEFTGDSVTISEVLNVTQTCTWEFLAHLNGTQRNTTRIAAIGVGALGSQVACNLARSGFGEWTLVDVDSYLPHNAARHALSGAFTGFGKAVAVAHEMNSFAPDDAPIARGIQADVLRNVRDDVNEVLESADLILDMSASVPVARHLSCHKAGKRVVSLFLNPSGTDLVTLAEDSARACTLNDLEMAYYWAAASDPRLADHLDVHRSPEGLAHRHVRYGASCRDVSSLIPHEFVALHAANGARALRQMAASLEATVAVHVYRPEDGGLQPVRIEAEPLCRCRPGRWEVRVAPEVLRQLIQLRKAALPNETGGVLIGGVDFEREVIFVVGLVPAPSDSEQMPYGFIRGSKQLSAALETIERRTLGNLSYLGEWHSHPNGTGTMPSADDAKLFTWIQENTVLDGRPAVMMIAGQRGECRVAVESISLHKTIRCPKK